MTSVWEHTDFGTWERYSGGNQEYGSEASWRESGGVGLRAVIFGSGWDWPEEVEVPSWGS